MTHEWAYCDGVRGVDRLRDPLRNKGTAFCPEERDRFDLDGLLPPRVESLDEQAERAFAAFHSIPSALDKYLFLNALQNDNETLFYRLVLDHLEEMLPIIYTPTVGDACLAWSHIYQRPRGLYISARHRGRIAQLLGNWPGQEVSIIVVTDGGRILGLGDLGVNGMGIPIGKLALYTACAGVPPDRTLPITLDVGTDNRALRDDPLYLGERQPRLTGEPYDALIDEFVSATQEIFPGVLVQFEDFSNANAFRLLERYRERLCCFNDDIQGTGAMGLAGLHAASRLSGGKLSDQRLLFVGAGEAGLGIGLTVLAALRAEGLSQAEALQRCLFVDSDGLVVMDRRDMPEHKRLFAQERPAEHDLRAIVETLKPTALIGSSGQGGQFTEPVLRAMARLNERPIVFALSNPTSKSECTAEQAYSWTDGRAIFASGSPFEPVQLRAAIRVSSQANNSHIFPGVGLGLLVSGARHATDEMFLAAARALADQVSQADLETGCVYPSAARTRDVAAAVAEAVATVAYDGGLATTARPDDIAAAVRSAMYQPRYEAPKTRLAAA